MPTSTAVDMEFDDVVRLTVASPLPSRLNWPRDVPLPRAGDEIVIVAASTGAQALRVGVERVEFAVTPSPQVLVNLFEATSATADVRVRMRLRLAPPRAAADA